MLDVKLFHMRSFLPMPYEEALAPRLKRAHEKLQMGSGAGGEFTGWVHLPRSFDRGELARIKRSAAKIQSDSKALVVIGIGGSYLGARGVIDCLCSPNYNLKKRPRQTFTLPATAWPPDALQEILELVEDEDFSVNVISKSGTTTEPARGLPLLPGGTGEKVWQRGGQDPHLRHHRQAQGRAEIPGGCRGVGDPSWSLTTWAAGTAC